ncbi:hypothetical protein GCM10007052_36540 [Halioglobus japonicus]|nr:hypothetical protein GCM10007052_36540 [Halioglobus japonicus]
MLRHKTINVYGVKPALDAHPDGRQVQNARNYKDLGRQLQTRRPPGGNFTIYAYLRRSSKNLFADFTPKLRTR